MDGTADMECDVQRIHIMSTDPQYKQDSRRERL
jgi:hypothetical protein